MSVITVERGSGVDPDGPEGQATFARLLGDAASAGIKTFPHSTPPGHPTERHVHTADVAACVVAGSMEIAFGPDYASVEAVGPGDFLLIPQGLAHQETVLGDQEVTFVVAHLRGFHTMSAGD